VSFETFSDSTGRTPVSLVDGPPKLSSARTSYSSLSMMSPVSLSTRRNQTTSSLSKRCRLVCVNLSLIRYLLTLTAQTLAFSTVSVVPMLNTCPSTEAWPRWTNVAVPFALALSLAAVAVNVNVAVEMRSAVTLKVTSPFESVVFVVLAMIFGASLPLRPVISTSAPCSGWPFRSPSTCTVNVPVSPTSSSTSLTLTCAGAISGSSTVSIFSVSWRLSWTCVEKTATSPRRSLVLVPVSSSSTV